MLDLETRNMYYPQKSDTESKLRITLTFGSLPWSIKDESHLRSVQFLCNEVMVTPATCFLHLSCRESQSLLGEAVPG